jgi:hypothetical protein
VKRAPSRAGSPQTEPARKMKLPIFIADAFTATAFRGNPAAVCLLERVSTRFSRAMPELPDVCRALDICKRHEAILRVCHFGLCSVTCRWWPCLQVMREWLCLDWVRATETPRQGTWQQHACNSGVPKEKAGDHESAASLGYIAGSRPTWAI